MFVGFLYTVCVDLCSVLDYFDDADKEDLVVNRKLHRKRQAGGEAIKSSEKSTPASVLGILAKVSSTYLLCNMGIKPSPVSYTNMY